MKNVAVFFGGKSVEHDVSLITGAITLNTLDKEKYNPVPVYVDKSGVWYTGEQLFDVDSFKNLNKKKLKRVGLTGGENILYQIDGKRNKKLFTIAAAINCMHGERGEDGSLCGVLKMNDIPLASPPLAASSVCMEKSFTKLFLKGIGVNALPCAIVWDLFKWKDAKEEIGYPCIVKPDKLGSSVGVSTAENDEQLERAVRYALSFGEKAIIERKLENFIEINCAAYMNERGEVVVSECERPIGRTEVLTFNDKYVGGERVFPADISKNVSDKIKRITKKIYLALGARGIIRIDYFLENGKVLVNEINTVPGSLAYYLFCDTLKEFKSVLNQLIALSEKEHAKSTTFVKEYHSGILSACGTKGAKRLKKRE